MDSVAPPDDDKTPIDNVLHLADELARLKDRIGEGAEDGMRRDISELTRGMNQLTVLFGGIDKNLMLLSAKLDAHMHTERERHKLDIELREAERQADATAAKKRCDSLEGKIDDGRRTLGYVLAGQATLFVMLAWSLLRGCS